MPIRNLLNSNIWQIVSPDVNNEPLLIFNRYIPKPTSNLVGGVRPDNITTFVDTDGVISALGNGTIGTGQFVPYVSFVSSPIASANQVFVAALLMYYQGNSSFATVSVDGAILQPSVDFVIGFNTITFLTFLEPNSLIEIQAKVLPVSQPQNMFITTEGGDVLQTQGGDNITIQQVFT